jgi:hypothetical protein
MRTEIMIVVGTVAILLAIPLIVWWWARRRDAEARSAMLLLAFGAELLPVGVLLFAFRPGLVPVLIALNGAGMLYLARTRWRSYRNRSAAPAAPLSQR